MDASNDPLAPPPDAAPNAAQPADRFRILVESITEYAIVLLDQTGRITSWNLGAQRINGYTADEALGRHFSLFFQPDDIRQGKPATVLERAAQAGAYQEEGWRVRKDGALFWANVTITALYDAGGALWGFGAITRDMTGWRADQAALQQSEERFRLLVEGVQEYAIFMLDPRGYIVSWNSGAQLIKGYTASEIVGRHFSVFYPPEDIRSRKPARELRIARAKGRYEEEGWRIRKDGSRFWANVLITALFDPQGRLYGFGKVTRDMTERKLAQEQRDQLREREDQLRREREARAQIEATARQRDAFLMILAHELRTPLTVLLGNAQLLLRRVKREALFSARDQRLVQIIMDQAARLSTMVQLHFDIARLETNQLRLDRAALEVGALAQQVVAEVQPTLTRHTVTYHGPATPLWIDGDALRLIQALHNLLQNAIKYSPAGGDVQVRVEPHGSMVVITVSDEGMGIPPADLPLLFQRFYRASNVDERQISGLGVGLYLVNELIVLHGGAITVESAVGQGSAFRISLPMCAAPAAEDAAAT